MKRTMRFAVAALLATALLPVNRAQADALIVSLFSGEAHLTAHRCNTLDKTLGVPSTCGSIKNRPTAFTFGASEAKKPKKDGNVTRCFAVKVVTEEKSWATAGTRYGPFCDIHVEGLTAKKILATGESPLGTCENSTGPFTGAFAVYESHAGPKKVSNIAGTFEIKGGFGRVFGSEKKKTKAAGGDFEGLIRVSAQGLTKGNTDTLDDCYLAVVNGKDDPQQVNVSGFAVLVQENQ